MLPWVTLYNNQGLKLETDDDGNSFNLLSDVLYLALRLKTVTTKYPV